jgi:predicted Zn-dependent protease
MTMFGGLGGMGGQGQRRTSGCGLRLILAAVILIGGAMSYFFSTQKNPITGEEQRVKLSPDQEVQLGLQSAPEMAAQMGGEVPLNDPREREVKAMGQKLVSKLPQNPYQFDFHLLNDQETINAFALPGGQIFITEALYSKLQNEAQLAGVLGHEVGHVVHRHAAEHMAQADWYNSIVMATGVGTGDQRAAAAAQYVAQIRQLKYGRDDELESDQWGLKLMADVGYDPHEMLGVMEILKSVSGGRGSEMMSTHPLPESRIQRINEYLAEAFKNGLPQGLTKGNPLPGNSGGQRGRFAEEGWR